MPLTQRGREMLDYIETRSIEIQIARAKVQALHDSCLWEILRGPCSSELDANRITWAKAELKRRRLMPERAP